MRALIAFDKFKDSLTAPRACEIAEGALKGRHPDWQVDSCPLADGGDGFASILTLAAGGRMIRRKVTGPRNGPVEAEFGLVALSRIPESARALLDLGAVASDSEIAVIEMASSSGLASVPQGERDPWLATSLGTGELIRAAAQLGASAILLGVGGSATHDLGLGALAALGIEFRGADLRPLNPPIPAVWSQIASLSGNVPDRFPPIRIACDVTNPLLGPRGAAAVYGPQKGLKAADLPKLEEATRRLAEELCRHCGKASSLAETPGAGAAGGISFGLMAAAGARLLPGFSLVSSWVDLDARIRAADLVVTGEGRFDASSWEGKGPGAVVARAVELGRPVHVFAGQVTGERGKAAGLHAITAAGTALATALREAPENLAAAVRSAL